MTREEFEKELRAAGFAKDVYAQQWYRPADALNGWSRTPFDAIDDAELMHGEGVFPLLLESMLDAIDVPSAVDRLADIARSDDGSGERAGLVVV